MEDFVVSLKIIELQNVLNKVIPIGILNKSVKVVNDYIGKSKFLNFSTFFEASLHDTASMLVGANFDTVHNASIKDELSVLLVDL